MKAGVSLSSQACLSGACPHWETWDVVCPSGFWGFKHIIEQPLSVTTEPDANGRRDLVLQIDAGASGGRVSALMVVSLELPQVSQHKVEMRSSGSFDYRIKDNKAEVGESMRDPESAAHLVYFYCHGKRERTQTWLGIGANERLQASDLTAYGIDWSDTHPLVFINGCHTADFSPDDLLNFNQVFSWCSAAGVIGTEISIPEAFARSFALGFLKRFCDGKAVGLALREQRMDLLARHNILGLAYTPYCSSDLKLVYR